MKIKKIGADNAPRDVGEAINGLNEAIQVLADMSEQNMKLREKALALEATLEEVEGMIQRIGIAVQGRWPFMRKKTILKLLTEQ